METLAAEGNEVFFVDAGDMLFASAGPLRGRPSAEDHLKKALLIARSMVAMGAKAVNVGRKDLAHGLDFLLALGAEPGVPWVSSNLARADGSYPFPRWRKFEWRGLTVGIVGVSAISSKMAAGHGLTVAPPDQALKEVLSELGDVDLVVCLSNLGLSSEIRLAKALQQPAVIIGGGTNELLNIPVVESGASIFHASNRGRYVGVLQLVEQEQDGPPPAASPPAAKQLSSRRALRPDLSSHKLVALSQDLEEEKTIRGWIDDYKKSIKAPVRRRRPKFPRPPMRRPPTPAQPPTSPPDQPSGRK